MFFLSELEHKLRLPPHLLDRPLESTVRHQLESIFLDKVIAKLGLIIHNEGAPTHTVLFRMVIFRPYVGEIFAAKLKESNLTGLRLTLGFFDDIYIPAYCLPDKNTRAVPDEEDPGQVTWIWSYEGSDYRIDRESEIRFKVIDVKYPPIPLEQEDGSKPFAPMVVTGGIDIFGLGPTEWWV